MTGYSLDNRTIGVLVLTVAEISQTHLASYLIGAGGVCASV